MIELVKDIAKYCKISVGQHVKLPVFIKIEPKRDTKFTVFGSSTNADPGEDLGYDWYKSSPKTIRVTDSKQQPFLYLSFLATQTLRVEVAAYTADEWSKMRKRQSV